MSDDALDKGWITRWWDFIDQRDIDKHVTAFCILTFMLISTVKISQWSFRFAERWLDLAAAGKTISGTEIAAVLAAVGGPWGIALSAIVPFTLSFYFKARA